MENTTNMNTPEIKVNLMNEVQGSVVSDQMLGKVDDLTEANRKIGQLEGQLAVSAKELDNTITNYEDQLDRQEKHVKVVVKTSSNQIVRDYWGAIIKAPQDIQTIDVENVDLPKLADAAIKAQALKDVKEADDKAKDAKDKMDLMEKTCKRNEKRANDEVDALRKTQKETLENAVKSATAREEKQNRKEIAELKLQNEALNKENDLQVEEKENLARERDLAIEAQAKHIRLLENRLNILNEPITNIYKSIKARMDSWRFNKRINRLAI